MRYRSCVWNRRLAAVGACLLLLAVTTAPVVASGAPPPNDECHDAILVNAQPGACEITEAACDRAQDCPGAQCTWDGTDCAGDPSVCTNHDLCENLVCVGGDRAGQACLSDLDTCIEGSCSASGAPCKGDAECLDGCDGFFCRGTCSLGGSDCYSPHDPEFACAGQDVCGPERCTWRVFGSTVGATPDGAWCHNDGGGRPRAASTSPNVWYAFRHTGNMLSVSTCHPGTDFDTGIIGGDCEPENCHRRDGTNFAVDINHVGPCVRGERCNASSRLDLRCADVRLAGVTNYPKSRGVETLLAVYGEDRCVGLTCSLTGGACRTTDDCDDRCGDKVCADGPRQGQPCSDDADVCAEDLCSASGDPCVTDSDCTGGCDGGSCGGTCSVSSAACFGPPGAEPQCSGLEPGDVCLGTCGASAIDCSSDLECERAAVGDLELTFTDTGFPADWVWDWSSWLSYVDPQGGWGGNPLFVLGAELTDDGDDDGIADANETVEMRLRVHNYGLLDLTNVVATLATEDATIASIPVAEATIGSVPAGTTVLADQAFRFVVADVDRVSPFQTLQARFAIAVTSDRFDHFSRFTIATGEHYPRAHLTLDLDLDVSDGTGPTTFREGFESGTLGAFTGMNLDSATGTNPEDSEGFFCQYDDPFNPDVLFPDEQDCSLAGSASHAENFYWRTSGPDDPDGGRAFSGQHALQMGLFDEAGEPTSPARVLEAVRTTDPIHVGRGNVCSSTRSLRCDEAADCPDQETCDRTRPELVFKHQMNVFGSKKTCLGDSGPTLCESDEDCSVGSRCTFETGRMGEIPSAMDRGFVQAQVLEPPGPWQTLQPHRNPYDSQASPWWLSCTFDPIDDGSTSADVSDYQAYPHGPSSSCFPLHVFNLQGDTTRPFDPAHVGKAVGPGLQGSLGIGTWVESAVSLERFRGKTIRLRFVFTSAEWGELEYFTESLWTDGWWIDDVRITDLLDSPSVLSADAKTCAPGVDGDDDGTPDCRDCAPGDAQAWATAGQVRNLRLSHSGGAGGLTTLSWDEVALPGAGDFFYVVRTQGDAMACNEASYGSATTAADATTPASGELMQFLVRADNACGAGDEGRESSGIRRSGCP